MNCFDCNRPTSGNRMLCARDFKRRKNAGLQTSIKPKKQNLTCQECQRPSAGRTFCSACYKRRYTAKQKRKQNQLWQRSEKNNYKTIFHEKPNHTTETVQEKNGEELDEAL